MSDLFKRKTEIKRLTLSLLLPILSMTLTTILILAGIRGVVITVLGFVCAGVIPLILITAFKVDTSKYFKGKMFLFVVLAVGFVLSWFVFESWTVSNFNVFVLPILIFIAEGIFALSRETNFKTKLCLILSSFVYVYAGFIIEIMISLARALAGS